MGSFREHRLVIDRFEGDLAVVEVDGARALDLPLWLLPPGCREGDVIRLRERDTEQGTREVTLVVDAEDTQRSRQEAERRLERLRSRDPGGDIAL